MYNQNSSKENTKLKADLEQYIYDAKEHRRNRSKAKIEEKLKQKLHEQIKKHS